MGTWSANIEPLGPAAVKVHVEWNGAPLTVNQALTLLETDSAFRAALVGDLRASSFDAYYWETPATNTNGSARFEYVLTHASMLSRATPDPSPFQQHFARASGPVVAFENLGGDAMLVVPTPLDDAAKYTHLAAFVRGAPEQQVDAFFQAVGKHARAKLSRSSTWLSTSGTGVYWLHVRLDARPKYYQHAPYRRGA